MTGVLLKPEERKAIITGRKADGSPVQATAELTEFQVGHLGGGEKVQLKFPDGTSSAKIAPLYLLPPNENAPSGMVGPAILIGVVLALGIAAGWWMWRRHGRARAVGGFQASEQA